MKLISALAVTAALLATPTMAATYLIGDNDGHGTSNCTIDQAVEVTIPGFDYSTGDVTLMCVTPRAPFSVRAAAVFAAHPSSGTSPAMPAPAPAPVPDPTPEPEPVDPDPVDPEPPTSVPSTSLTPATRNPGTYVGNLTGTPYEDDVPVGPSQQTLPADYDFGYGVVPAGSYDVLKSPSGTFVAKPRDD